jgi:hypothetical protein
MLAIRKSFAGWVMASCGFASSTSGGGCGIAPVISGS